MASNPQIILIDGPAGSGKTSLSIELAAELHCQVIHLDDHYNGWDQALGPELTSTLKLIVSNFLQGKESLIPTYNWHLAQFDSERTIAAAETLIIEGVGAGQSSIRNLAKRLYWVEADKEIALQRVLERDGNEYKERIKTWQIREAKHFNEERTRDFADFIISTT